MKNLTIILDAAHGEEVPGKRSPDGKFREYLGSRERIKELTIALKALGYEVFESNPTTKEIGLSQRAAAANAVAKPHKIFLSLHVDAAGNGAEGMKARGYSVYTTKGQNNSDKIAEIIMQQFAHDFPELKMRADKTDGDLDTEENFTVIYKTNCPAALIEGCFQDSKEDIAILTNPEYNKRYVKSLVEAINKINDILV